MSEKITKKTVENAQRSVEQNPQLQNAKKRRELFDGFYGENPNKRVAKKTTEFVMDQGKDLIADERKQEAWEKFVDKVTAKEGRADVIADMVLPVMEDLAYGEKDFKEVMDEHPYILNPETGQMSHTMKGLLDRFLENGRQFSQFVEKEAQPKDDSFGLTSEMFQIPLDRESNSHERQEIKESTEKQTENESSKKVNKERPMINYSDEELDKRMASDIAPEEEEAIFAEMQARHAERAKNDPAAESEQAQDSKKAEGPLAGMSDEELQDKYTEALAYGDTSDEANAIFAEVTRRKMGENASDKLEKATISSDENPLAEMSDEELQDKYTEALAYGDTSDEANAIFAEVTRRKMNEGGDASQGAKQQEADSHKDEKVTEVAPQEVKPAVASDELKNANNEKSEASPDNVKSVKASYEFVDAEELLPDEEARAKKKIIEVREILDKDKEQQEAEPSVAERARLIADKAKAELGQKSAETQEEGTWTYKITNWFRKWRRKMGARSEKHREERQQEALAKRQAEYAKLEVARKKVVEDFKKNLEDVNGVDPYDGGIDTKTGFPIRGEKQDDKSFYDANNLKRVYGSLNRSFERDDEGNYIQDLSMRQIAARAEFAKDYIDHYKRGHENWSDDLEEEDGMLSNSAMISNIDRIVAQIRNGIV